VGQVFNLRADFQSAITRVRSYTGSRSPPRSTHSAKESYTPVFRKSHANNAANSRADTIRVLW